MNPTGPATDVSPQPPLQMERLSSFSLQLWLPEDPLREADVFIAAPIGHARDEGEMKSCPRMYKYMQGYYFKENCQTPHPLIPGLIMEIYERRRFQCCWSTFSGRKYFPPSSPMILYQFYFGF